MARLAGHKFDGIRYMAQAKCECGWEGARWIGKGSRSNAVGEWHSHIDGCEREKRLAKQAS